jgi:hypothetical protein
LEILLGKDTILQIKKLRLGHLLTVVDNVAALGAQIS